MINAGNSNSAFFWLFFCLAIKRLIDERKSEIAELMAVRTKFSETGEFQPEWKPPVRRSFGLVKILNLYQRIIGNRSSSRASCCSRDRGCSCSKTGLACCQSTAPRKESKNAAQVDRCRPDPRPCRSGSTEA